MSCTKYGVFFLQLAAEEKTSFLLQLKQIFGPSYFVRALVFMRFDLKVQKITREIYIEIEMRLQINVDLNVEISFSNFYVKFSLRISR